MNINRQKDIQFSDIYIYKSKRKITFYKFTLINFQNINLKKYKRQFLGNEKWLFFPFSSYSSPQEETNENMRVMEGVILHKYLIITYIMYYLSKIPEIAIQLRKSPFLSFLSPKTRFQNPEKSHFYCSRHPFQQEFTKLNASWKLLSLTWFKREKTQASFCREKTPSRSSPTLPHNQ